MSHNFKQIKFISGKLSQYAHLNSTKFATSQEHETETTADGEEWLPENFPEFWWILWSLDVCIDPIYNL